jgi:hypothetical protein
MALTIIGGKDGTAAFSIAAVAYTCALTEHELESNVNLVDQTTFCTETAPTYDTGPEITNFRLAGLLTKGAAYSGPLYPLPQNVAIVQTFATGCTITGTGVFTRGVARRTAGANGVIAAEGRYTGAVVKAWVVS